MKPKRIALDANEANVASRVGSNVFAFKLLQELESQTRGSDEFTFTVYLSGKKLDDLPQERKNWHYHILKPKSLWTQWRFPLELFFHQNSYDLVLSLGHYGPRFSSIPSVICIMDLAFLHFPQFFRSKDLYQLTNWTKYSAGQAKHIVTISQNSKLDIIKEYGRGAEEVSVVYPGVDTPKEMETAMQNQVLEKFNLTDKKYFVAVGTIQPRKNMINLIKAFERLEDQLVRLVFVGKSGWLTTEFEEALAMSPVKDRIVVTGFVDEATKYALLTNALGNILVGFYEGFGIPPIEGMSVGVLPIVANTASLPEVVGDLGIQVDPYDVDSIASGLTQVLETKIDTELKNKLKARAREFSWARTGSDMLEVLRQLNP